MLNVAIVGAGGYAGGELLRLLLAHPQVTVVAATARSYTGQAVAAAHPNLTKVTDLRFVEEDLPVLAAAADFVFLALPHGEALTRVPALRPHCRVIDLGGDFRLKDAATFAQFYGRPHTAPDLLAEAVYGLPEVNRAAIRSANLVAAPGCFPTGAILALWPLVQAGWLTGPVICDSKTGSSGSGHTPAAGTHHPERAGDFRAYSLFNHRHQPEIAQTLHAGMPDLQVIFTPHSTPMVRGIFTTAYAFLATPRAEGEVQVLYEAAYTAEPFVRLVAQARSTVVAHSNFCDVSVASDGATVIVTTAIDNLVKGAAGQAVQAMNIMAGLPETAGLTFPGTYP